MPSQTKCDELCEYMFSTFIFGICVSLCVVLLQSNTVRVNGGPFVKSTVNNLFSVINAIYNTNSFLVG